MVQTYTIDPNSDRAAENLGRRLAHMLLTSNEQAWAELFIERKRGGKVVLTANVTK